MHPNMEILSQGNVTAINSGIASDTFNCLFGWDERVTKDVIEALLKGYEEKGYPFAWWIAPSYDSERLRRVFAEVGLVKTEVDVAMAMKTEQLNVEVVCPKEIRIEEVSGDKLRDFGKVLASIFSPFDDNVVRFYEEIVPYFKANESSLFVMYESDFPCTIGSLHITGDFAGIYDIATHPDFRKRGYGTLMTGYLLETIQKRGISWVGLEASREGLNIYKKLGFNEYGTFFVYTRSRGE